MGKRAPSQVHFSLRRVLIVLISVFALNISNFIFG